MFRLPRSVNQPKNKPQDEERIEKEAHTALRESRKQINRAAEILAGEVRRIDEVLNRGRDA